MFIKFPCKNAIILYHLCINLPRLRNEKNFIMVTLRKNVVLGRPKAHQKRLWKKWSLKHFRKFDKNSFEDAHRIIEEPLEIPIQAKHSGKHSNVGSLLILEWKFLWTYCEVLMLWKFCWNTNESCRRRV